MAELSAYEIKRLETIRKNAEMLKSLGIDDAVASMKPAAKSSPKRKQLKPAQPLNLPRRRSSRAAGLMEGEEMEEAQTYRDPNDVSQMSNAEFRQWCEAVLDGAASAEWLGTLTAEQKARVDTAKEWLLPFAEYTARPPDSRPLSRPNLKSVLRQIIKLVSGAGVDTDKRSDVFAAGRPISLGITAHEVLQLRAEAQLWMPLHPKSPADLVGKRVGDQVVPARPAQGPYDTSNGWLLNHPLMKLSIYCAHLDEMSSETAEAADSSPQATQQAGCSPTTQLAAPSADAARTSEPPFTSAMVRDVIEQQVRRHACLRRQARS